MSAQQSKAAKKDKSIDDSNQLYAIIRTGSKQYTVRAGEKVEVEHLTGDVGQIISLGEVLFVKSGDLSVVGTPVVSGAQVRAKIVEQMVGPNRTKKVLIYKKKRRHGYTKKQGHRQSKTRLMIEEIVAAA